MSDKSADLLRSIPSVAKILGESAAVEISAKFGEGVFKLQLRHYLDELRERIQSRELSAIPTIEQILATLSKDVTRFSAEEGRRAINATGVLLHTGLGRAPLSDRALHAMSRSGYSLLQFELGTGGRSIREHKIERMLQELTGCEAVTVCNNNAAATYLILHEIGCGKEMIISRGQLIEIGGSFRMPDVMERSGTKLREVGTTNRTHLSDYEKAINENTAAILHVHPSNYSIEGFTGSPSIPELCELGREKNVPVIADLGSGALVPLNEWGLSHATTIADALSAGSVLTCSSGDKLIGGPQAGIICGNSDMVTRVRKNPFARMFRTDKATNIALEVTLESYINSTFREEIPLYQMLSLSMESLEARAEALKTSCSEASGFEFSIEEDFAFVGGGALPEEKIKSIVLCVKAGSAKKKFADKAALKLRMGLPSIICRVRDERLIFDMRTLSVSDHETVSKAILSLST